MTSGAIISPDGLYRYRLWRRWADGAALLFVMLNPSTADAEEDDPTIRKCTAFARALGYAGIEVANLFAWRSTDPLGLRAAMDPVGPLNDDALVQAVGEAKLVIAAWGSLPQKPVWMGARARHVLELLTAHADVHALRLSQSGQPGHPLYLPGNPKPFIYRERRRAA